MATAQASKYDNPVINTPATRRNDCHLEPVWTVDKREMRAATLAARYGMTAGWARYLCGTRDGHTILRVQSHTDCTRRYEVRYNPHTDTVYSCDCAALGPCSHMGAARQWVERGKVARAMAERQAECERMAAHYDYLEACGR